METENKPIENNSNRINVKLWRNIALVAGIFSFVMCFLIIANYFQLNRLDPVNTELINALVERLNQNPQDEALRQEIRELDLLVRKAYFTNHWQIKTGGYLLLIGIAVFIIAFQIIEYTRKTSPEEPVEDPYDLLKIQKQARKWISLAGGIIVVATLVVAFITQNHLKDTFIAKAGIANQDNIIEESINDSETALVEETSRLSEPVETNQNIQESDDLIEKQETVVIDNPEKEEVEITPASSEVKKIQKFSSFRGEGGNGIALAKNVPTDWDVSAGKNLLWKVEIPLHGYNSPIIWGDKVFITGANATNREIYCFDLNTGKLLWTSKADNIEGSPEKAPDVTEDTGHAAPTMTTNGKNVFAIFSNGDLVALDLDGNRKWAKNLGLPQNHYGHSSSLIMHEDLLIVQYDQRSSAKVIAFNSSNGEEVWKTIRKVKISWASPVIVNTGNRFEIILAADPGVASYDVKTGKELWKMDCIYGEVGPSVAYADGLVFATNEYASLVAIEIGDSPKILWEDYEYLSDVPSPVAYNELLFMPTSYGVVACYEAKTGTKLWEHEFDNGFYSSPIIAEGNIYLVDRKGVTQIFKADREFSLVAANPLGEDTFTTPAFVDGKLVIRGDNNLYCIGK